MGVVGSVVGVVGTEGSVGFVAGSVGTEGSVGFVVGSVGTEGSVGFVVGSVGTEGSVGFVVGSVVGSVVTAGSVGCVVDVPGTVGVEEVPVISDEEAPAEGDVPDKAVGLETVDSELFCVAWELGDSGCGIAKAAATHRRISRTLKTQIRASNTLRVPGEDIAIRGTPLKIKMTGR